MRIKPRVDCLSIEVNLQNTTVVFEPLAHRPPGSCGIEPAGMKWVTPPNPLRRTPKSRERTEFCYCINRVLRACGGEAAGVRWKERGNENLIRPNDMNQQCCHQLRGETLAATTRQQRATSGWILSRVIRSIGISFDPLKYKTMDAEEWRTRSVHSRSFFSRAKASRKSLFILFRRTALYRRLGTTKPTRSGGTAADPKST